MAWSIMDSRSANLYCRSVQVFNKLCRSVSSVGLACLPLKHTGLPAFQAATRLQPDTPLDCRLLTIIRLQQNRTWSILQKPGSWFLQLNDHSHTLNSNTVHVIGFQNHPEVSWFLIGPLRSHGAMCTKDQTLEYSFVWLWAIDDRKARVPASRVGYHKQTKFKKTMITATPRRVPPGLIKVRQLGKLCADGSIPQPVYIL